MLIQVIFILFLLLSCELSFCMACFRDFCIQPFRKKYVVPHDMATLLNKLCKSSFKCWYQRFPLQVVWIFRRKYDECQTLHATLPLENVRKTSHKKLLHVRHTLNEILVRYTYSYKKSWYKKQYNRSSWFTLKIFETCEDHKCNKFFKIKTCKS